MLAHGLDQIDDSLRLLLVDLVLRNAVDVVSHTGGLNIGRIGLAEWANAAVVGKPIAESNDLGDTAEVFDEANGISERLPAEVINGEPIVEESRVWDVANVGIDQVMH